MSPCDNLIPIAKRVIYIILFGLSSSSACFKDAPEKLYASNFSNSKLQFSVWKILSKVNQCYPFFVSHTQSFFFFFWDFSHFQERILGVMNFSENAQLREKRFSYESINLFIMGPFKDLCGNVLTRR